MNHPPLKPGFPAFGGKKKVASLVWSKLGDPANFIEPFANSAAVLLARPTPGRIETVNDSNNFIANYWRAVQHDPEAVVQHCDFPVNEADLHAVHKWLVGWTKPEPVVPARFARHPLLREAYLAGAAIDHSSPAQAFAARMKADPDYFDAVIAGRWVWGACCWIGSGWCSVDELRLDGSPRAKLPAISRSGGVHQASGPSQKRPILSAPENQHGERTHHGIGVHAKVPLLSGRSEAESYGRGIHEKRPRAARENGSNSGGDYVGVHALGPSDKHRPQLADAYARGRGVHANDSAGTCAERRAWLLDWFGRLSDRLRTVRVCCGDWLRVCDSESVTTRIGVTGIFLDPPYKTHLASGASNRSGNLYANDRTQDVNALVDDVIRYCVERGSDPKMRIVAASYEGEGYEVLLDHGWECIAWKSNGGYGNRGNKGRPTASNENAARERLWVSPHCVRSSVGRDHQPMMAIFDAGEVA